MIQKSYKVNVLGTLYLVPTPIGNMDDITYRALEVLKNSDCIYAEDTRNTKLLLEHNAIYTHVKSCHKFSEEKNKQEIIDLLLDGKNVSYVSDRGTPLISDPGSVVVEYAIKNNINVVSLPGPSALLPALNMSGLSNERFLFYGFLSNKKNQLEKELEDIKFIKQTLIFYESPYRLQETLKSMLKVLGNRKISVVREISKIHEEVFRGIFSEAIEEYKEVKGEIVIIVDGNTTKEEVDYDDIYYKLIEEGYSMSSAIKEISTNFGVSKNMLYNKFKSKEK